MRYTIPIPAVGDADAEVYENVTYGELRDLEERIIDLQGKLRRKNEKSPLLEIVTIDRIGIHINPTREYISRFRGKRLTEVLFQYAEDVEKEIYATV